MSHNSPEDHQSEQSHPFPQYTPERPPHLNKTVTGRVCACGCSCTNCTCESQSKSNQDALDIPGRDLETESHSLVTEISGLTVGDSIETGASFDREMEYHDQRLQQIGHTEDDRHDEADDEGDMNLDDVNDNPHLYFLERRRSGDSNEVYMSEPFIFEPDSSNSMDVNISPENEELMLSYVSSLSPSSSGSSALLKGAGAIFDPNRGSESGQSRQP